MLPVRSTVSTPPRVLRVATTSHPESPLELRAELKTPSKREFLMELDDGPAWLSRRLPSVYEYGADVRASSHPPSERK